MKISICNMAICVAVLCVAFAAISISRENNATGQSPSPRYHLETFATPFSGMSPIWGSYIIDTTTGALWLSTQGTAPKKLVDSLK